uniref:Uncharacterized protein n=1 Tax=Chromera velia CCMP2878 TaxID=1169474 RepID=A0A0G4HSS1_9ALVE|eukprot:Cvel_8344.t1-p1 / transcript=Cvel_8344.t1 / gene=Cvel_8344 / organism=Chromera_velia_CCMP2878 / gene_product=hypothetical protein / transcript_product=hypothetical protein / location=Cvel_scaffold459:48717-49840(-) / protein_length=158 / sequence_SO=supercontig / SO=protein_coding / is_pseudo=false
MIPHVPHQTFGSGRYKLFNRAQVQAYALQKHGAAGLQKKRQAREVREARKRQKEESAEQAARALARGQPLPRVAEDAEEGGDSTAGRSVVKNGAWHTLRMSIEEFFGEEKIYGSGGTHGCNSQICIGAEEEESDLTLKYCASSKILSIGAWIQQDPWS